MEHTVLGRIKGINPLCSLSQPEIKKCNGYVMIGIRACDSRYVPDNNKVFKICKYHKKVKDKQLKVWWIPQIPGKAFTALVDDLKQARLLLDALAEYDKFQFENNIKPDYCNVGGLEIWDESLDADDNGDKWATWYDEDTGMEFDEYCEQGHLK